MGLSNQDISLFARDAVRAEIRTERDRDTVCSWAKAMYGRAQHDVRESGYRVTRRVRDGLWAALDRISQEGLGR